MNIDSRFLGRNAYEGLDQIKTSLATESRDPEKHKEICGKASSVVQGLASYIGTWGLHRLAGDANKDRSGKTKYKNTVYTAFLDQLKLLSKTSHDIKNPKIILKDIPLKEYLQLNRLAIELAQEWSFWAPAILGEAKNDD